MEPGQKLRVEKLPVYKGDQVELDRVLLVADGNAVTVGHPVLEGAKVLADVLEQGLGEKIIVFKTKAKTRYHRKNGHRQPYTELLVQEIVTPPPATKPPRRHRRATSPAAAQEPSETREKQGE